MSLWEWNKNNNTKNDEPDISVSTNTDTRRFCDAILSKKVVIFLSIFLIAIIGFTIKNVYEGIASEYEEVYDLGIVSNNVTGYLYADGSLVISGTGTIKVTDPMPWDTEREDITSISFDGRVIAPKDCDKLFSNLSNLAEIDLTNFVLGNAISINQLFYGDTSLLEIDLSMITFDNLVSATDVFSNSIQVIKTPIDTNINIPLPITMYDTAKRSQFTKILPGYGRLTLCYKEPIYEDSDGSIYYVDEIDTTWDISANKDGSINAYYLTTGVLLIKGSGTMIEQKYAGRYDPYNPWLLVESVEYANWYDLKALPWCFESYTAKIYKTVIASDCMIPRFSGLCMRLTRMTEFKNDSRSKPRNLFSAFLECRKLEKVDFGPLDMSGATTISKLFNNCMALEEFDMSGFDFSACTDFSAVFATCPKLKKVILGDINCPKLNTVGGMFEGCTALEEIVIGDNINMPALKSIYTVFKNCSSLKSVKNLDKMFSNLPNIINCGSLYNGSAFEEIDLTNATFSLVEDRLMLDFAANTNSLKKLTIGENVAKLPDGTFKISSPKTLKLVTNNLLALNYDWTADNRLLIDVSISSEVKGNSLVATINAEDLVTTTDETVHSNVLKYKWMKDVNEDDDVTNDVEITGETNNTLEISQLNSKEGEYYCVVSNGVQDVKSDKVTLTSAGKIDLSSYISLIDSLDKEINSENNNNKKIYDSAPIEEMYIKIDSASGLNSSDYTISASDYVITYKSDTYAESEIAPSDIGTYVITIKFEDSCVDFSGSYETDYEICEKAIYVESEGDGTVSPNGLIPLSATEDLVELTITFDSNATAEVYVDDTKVVTLETSGTFTVSSLLAGTTNVKVVFIKTASGGSGNSSSSSQSSNTTTQGASTSISVKVIDHKSYVGGYKDGTFKPNQVANRSEVAAILCRIDDNYSDTKSYNEAIKYKDVSSDFWAYNYIQYLTGKNILNGSNYLFRPTDNMTRAEFATVIVRMFNLKPKSITVSNFYSGNKWYSNSVNIVTSYGYMNAFSNGDFGALKSITRAEVCKIINSVTGRTITGDVTNTYIAKVTTKFSDVKPENWFFKDVLEATIDHNKAELH